MDITGKIIAALPPRTGTSSKGTQWQCNTYVLETQEQYPKRVAFDVFGIDRINQLNVQVGQCLTVSFDIDAHVYQGRWYNTVRAWAVTPVAQQPAPSAPQGYQPAPPQPQAAPAAQQGAVFAQPAIPPQQPAPQQPDLPF